MKNPRNFFLIYFHVLFNYLIYFVALTCVLTIIGGFMSKWSMNLAADGIAGMSRNPQRAFGQLSILTISAFFSALEVKSLGLGWICYFGLLISRVYYLFRPQGEWYYYPDYVRGFWDFIIIVHPITHYFFGGKFAERAAMTAEQQETMREFDREQRRQYAARQRSFDGYRNTYNQLTPYQKRELSRSDICSGDDYARNKMGDP
jgi:hypothetical protein